MLTLTLAERSWLQAYQTYLKTDMHRCFGRWSSETGDRFHEAPTGPSRVR